MGEYPMAAGKSRPSPPAAPPDRIADRLKARRKPRTQAMKFTGEIVIDAAREPVFAKVRDARFFASCVEGVQDLNEIDPTITRRCWRPRSRT